MKKILIFAVLLPAILLCFTSCEWMFIPPDDDTTGGQHTTTGEGTGTEDDTTSATSETVYSLLTSLSAQSYREVALQITTQTGDVTLQARYLLTPSLVTYEVEHLNLLPPDGDLTGVSPDYKTTLSGSATIENGKVTKIDGEAVTLPEYDELKGCFLFVKENFANEVKEAGTWSADVVRPADFLGTDKAVSDMKIVVSYTSEALMRLELTYQIEQSTVTTVYGFTK